MKTSIVWFKTDLRLRDNETLIRAMEQSDRIVPVYCFNEAQFATGEFGFKKTGSFRAQFLMESLADLDQNLRALGSGLVVLKGKPEEELVKAAGHYGATKVFAKKEVAFEEKQTQNRVEKELWKAHCVLETFSTSTLYHALDLPFSIKDIPDIFTNFRKKVERESQVRKVFDAPVSISSPTIPSLWLPGLDQFGLGTPAADKRAAMLFKGGETMAHKRLHYYFFDTHQIANYKETRNGLIGEGYSTKFSPWLALGCLSPREIYFELKRYETNHKANDSTYWLEFELLWRDFFRFMMKKHQNAFFRQQGISPHKAPVYEHHPQKLQAWIDGKTGVDFVDANMSEMKLTGYMSNRGRQNVASYLCNDLKTDWRYGAAYFEQQLIDYDECSNWGNWAYLAHAGNDPRENRYFNIEKQAATYDKNREYRNRWLSEKVIL